MKERSAGYQEQSCGPVKDFGFYLKCTRKSLNGLNQGLTNMVAHFTLRATLTLCENWIRRVQELGVRKLIRGQR